MQAKQSLFITLFVLKPIKCVAGPKDHSGATPAYLNTSEKSAPNVINARQEGVSIPYINSMYEFRKMVILTCVWQDSKKHRCIEQSFGCCGRGRGWDG